MCFDDDVVLALEQVVPVERGRGDAVDAVALGVLQVVPDLGGEEHGLGGNAAPVQAGAAELVGLLDERDLQAKLRGANGAGIAGGAAADDDEVIDSFCQESELHSLGDCGQEVQHARVGFNFAGHLSLAVGTAHVIRCASTRHAIQTAPIPISQPTNALQEVRALCSNLITATRV